MAACEVLSLLSFLALPPLVAYLLWGQWLTPRQNGTRALQIGLALIFGPLLTAPALLTAQVLALPLSPIGALIGLTLVGLALGISATLVGRIAQPARTTSPLPPAGYWFSPRADRLILYVLTALIVLRLASLLPDLLLRPVFPWDAWKSWAWKAKLWFELGERIPIAASREWLTAAAETHVIDGVNHPDTISLVILWSAIGLGRWDDSLLGLPWLLCGIGMALTVYGTLRTRNLPKSMALAGVYLLLSLPMLSTHMVLWGYADLWMAGLFTAFTAGLVLWQQKPERGAAVMLALSLLTMAFIKDTGSYWIPVLLAALITMALPRPWLRWGGGLALIGMAALILAPIDPVAILTQSRFRLDPGSIEGAWPGMGRHLFLWLDWHLLGYLLPLVLILAIRQAGQSMVIRSLLILILVSLAALLLAFSLTRAAQYAVIGTLFSRMFLHVVPAIVVLTLLTINHWRQRDDRETKP